MTMALTQSLLTPPGEGGIAVIEVRGPGAAGAVDRVFRSPRRRRLAEAAPGSLLYGRIFDDESVLDEVIVAVLGADILEVNCHGGAAATRGVSEALAGCGADSAPRGEDEEGDRIVREAMDLLTGISTELQLTALWPSVSGRASAYLASCIGRLEGPEPGSARVRMERLLADSERAARLLLTRRVVLLGPANSGKSTLFNRLLGEERAIVSGTPGTKRDVISQKTALDGVAVELCDTAGIVPGSGGGLAEAAARAALDAASRADLVCLVFDGSRRISPEEEREFSPFLAGPGVLTALNKSDLGRGNPLAGIRISALTGEGVEALAREAGDLLVPRSHRSGARDVALAGSSAIRMLREAAEELADGRPDRAAETLRRMIGAAAVAAEASHG